MDGRTVPYDLSAERAVLGAILLDREAILAVRDTLPAADFYLERHAQIYAAMLDTLSAQVPPDLTTVADVLRRREQLEPIGGLAALGDLLAEVPTAVHIEYYAEVVTRTATLRRLIEAGGQISALGYDERDDLATTLDAAEQTLFRVTQRPGGAGFVPVGQVMGLLLADAETDNTGVVPTGLYELDARLDGGLHPGNLVLLAARPGLGKTGLALSIAHELGVRRGLGVGVVSLEMSQRELGYRLLAIHTGVDTRQVRGLIRGGDSRMIDAMGVIDAAPIALDDAAGQTVLDVRAKARRLAAAGGLDLLIIDYLQLLLSDAPGQSRVDEVSRVSRQLKLLAKELHCPILALSQLSRALMQRASKVPQLSDLRDSGALEQDADVVLFIHRDEAYDPQMVQQGVAELHIAKNRHGPTGTVAVLFDGPTTRFASLERRRQ
jgi:replicative DNA helicase